MTFKDRVAYQTALIGSNMYVPAMGYSSELLEGQPTPFSLGSPAASDDNLIAATIDADAVATTIEHYETVWTSDAKYGRNLIVTPSADPGNSFAIKVHGRDYLGQHMTETFTGANGSTAILYGKKAFYGRVYTEIVTAATNAITAKLGTGTRLGLPYKTDVLWAKENGAFVDVFKRDFVMLYYFDAAACVAGGSQFLRTPVPGYVKQLREHPSGGGSTTNAATTVELGGTAITGLTVTSDQDTTTEVTDTPTTVGYSANNRLVANGLIEVVHAATTAGGAINGEVIVTPTQVTLADTTDPATATTGDPRGTYEAIMTLDGSEIIVGLLGDNAVNASNNGGLHGIAQV